MGTPVVTDLAKMPHLLIAGATGSGKSVGLNAMILSILYKATPEEVRFLMVDPKRIELSMYEGIPHLLHPVVFNPKEATIALHWAVGEMERRYALLSDLSVRNIEGYNQKAGVKKPDPRIEEGILPRSLPYLVIVIDELADLMLVSSRDTEEYLIRLAQKARASGIHLIVATQRPSVDVITGLIKANFPTRDLLPGFGPDGLPGHPGRHGGRAPPGHGRPPVHAAGHLPPEAHPRPLRLRRGSQPGGGIPEGPGGAGL